MNIAKTKIDPRYSLDWRQAFTPTFPLSTLEPEFQSRISIAKFKISHTPRLTQFQSTPGSYLSNAPFYSLSRILYRSRSGSLLDLASKPVFCGTPVNGRSRGCNSPKYCSYCAWLKFARSFAPRLPEVLPGQSLLSCTYSWKSNVSLFSCTSAEFLSRFQAVHDHLEYLRSEQLISGWLYAEETHINHLSTGSVLPHVHVILLAPHPDLYTLLDDGTHLAHPALALNAPGSTFHSQPICDDAALRKAARYLFKPLDLAASYSAEAGLTSYPVLNSALEDLLTRYHFLTSRRHRFGFKGSLRKAKRS